MFWSYLTSKERLILILRTLAREIKEGQNSVFGVSVSKSENRLIVCTKDELILIINIG